MTSAPDRLVRKPLRARGHDYADPGLYFLTICVHHMEPRFGTVAPTGVVLNSAGLEIESLWTGIPNRHAGVALDAYVVMPNHLHGIVVSGAEPGTRPLPLSTIVGQFKSLTRAAYSAGVRAGLHPPYDRSLWRRGFCDHIIRNERSLTDVRAYIESNAARWLDRSRRE